MNKLSPAIEATGYGITGDIGGLPRQTYYTPDGRVVKAIPGIRQYVIKDKDGKVIESGTRDANYDKGWLSEMPTELKLHCSGCDMYHDTQEEVDACVERKRKFLARYEAIGRKEIAKERRDKDIEITNLTSEIDKLKEKMEELLNASPSVS